EPGSVHAREGSSRDRRRSGLRRGARMTPRRHLDDLFTAAYDDELSPIDEARFQTHMQSCAPCAEAYAEFRATVEALRELPPRRRPRFSPPPATPPGAERSVRPRIGLGWFALGIVRRFPATAIA